MPANVAFSKTKHAADAAKELQKSLGNPQNKLIVYFASSEYDPAALASEVQKAFGNAATLGCTSSGELTSGQMLKSSVVAMALGSDIINDVCLYWVDLKNTKKSVTQAMEHFENHFKTPVSKMRRDQFVGLVLADGLSGAEEQLMDVIGNKTTVPFVGGSAGDDLKFQKTHVFSNGEAKSQFAALAMLSTKAPFEILKTQSFSPLDKKLVVTKADESTRTVREFNNKPAVQAYAEVLGTTPDHLADHFMTNPVGLMVSATEPFVRSPQKIDGQSVVFYCAIKEGMELSLLKGTDIVGDTRKVIEEAAKKGKISALLNFHCILRTLQLEQEKKTGSYGEIFSKIPTVGFSTYGEAYVGHINQTSTLLVFR